VVEEKWLFSNLKNIFKKVLTAINNKFILCSRPEEGGPQGPPNRSDRPAVTSDLGARKEARLLLPRGTCEWGAAMDSATSCDTGHGQRTDRYHAPHHGNHPRLVNQKTMGAGQGLETLLQRTVDALSVRAGDAPSHPGVAQA